MIRPGSRRRLRIAYLAHGVDGRQGGVHAKILSQAATWAKLDPGIEVGVFVRCEAGVEADWDGQPHVRKVRSSRTGVIGRLIQRELLSLDVARWRPDLLYLRQSTVSPSIVMLAAALPTVVELNTLDLRELRIRSSWRYRYATSTRDMVLRAARGLVVVARPIANDATVRRVGRPTVVIPNAIDLSLHAALAPAANPAPRLVFLGSPQTPWHGVDKILRLARLFPTWTFDVVGPSANVIADIPPNLRVHGPLNPEEFLPILELADVAIGPLALHRLQLAEASPLKVAEYLAHGIPTIIGYTDARFPEGAPFLLEIPNREDNVESSVDRIDAFVNAWSGRRVDREAIADIDTRVIERRRLDFMRQALTRHLDTVPGRVA